ncbi:heme biosynthesis HemY N-terminal domain-containing protein [Legionella londiniensis]|uniref:Protoporphyrinogen oxidase n=1 Tax=Legionella londiniensis TaxID=45068 RepID=A0A0W0VSB8_9GAMM|nr:heme biosynthesis HemY N-terminal domain-containing protein [Legionella londiniensis]KTD23063.1 protoporphyrinogen oxidase [Legionella londiniensis]STX94080.1 HemY protein [Legionella londiniensis]
MIRILLIFVLLMASILLGVQLQKDPGYVLIAFDRWTLETTLWVALFALLITFLLLHFLWHFLRWFMRLPSAWQQWREKSRVQKAQAKTRQGLIEFSEGYWQRAKKHLIKALPNADTPLLNYLTAARAAQEMGDSQLRDEYLSKAQRSMPEATVAVELTQAQLQLANQQWEQALATLKHLQTLAPHHPYVLKLLMNLYQQVRDWPQLIALLPDLKNHQVVTGDAYKRLEQYAYLKALCDRVQQKEEEAVKTLFARLPKYLKEDPEILAVYNRFLLENHDFEEAESLLRRSLGKQFNEELIALYGQIPEGKGKLSFAESLLKVEPHNAALYLCLGRLSRHQNLWGKARTYFEKSLDLHPSAAGYAELGKLLEDLNDESGACIAYRQGLFLMNEKNNLSQEN